MSYYTGLITWGVSLFSAAVYYLTTAAATSLLTGAITKTTKVAYDRFVKAQNRSRALQGDIVTSSPSSMPKTIKTTHIVTCTDGRRYEITFSFKEQAAPLSDEEMQHLAQFCRQEVLEKLDKDFSKEDDQFTITLNENGTATANKGYLSFQGKNVVTDPQRAQRLYNILAPLTVKILTPEETTHIRQALAEGSLPKRPSSQLFSLPKIPNGGNTCFLAAMMHAHFSDPEIIKAAEKARDEAEENSDQKEALTILCKYLEAYKNAPAKRASIHHIEGLRRALFLLNPDIFKEDSTAQEDATEAAKVFLAVIRPHLPAHYKTQLVGTLKLQKNSFFSRFNKPQKQDNEPEESYGELNLSISKNSQLSSSIDAFFHDKPNTGLKVDNIGYKVLSKDQKLLSAPERLTLTFNRFDQHGRKNGAPIRGVQEALLLPYVEGFSAAYQLEGVIIHQGNTIEKGHYIALRRTQNQDGTHSYWSASDSEIQEISVEDFLMQSQHAYQLIYRKVEKKADGIVVRRRLQAPPRDDDFVIE